MKIWKLTRFVRNSLMDFPQVYYTIYRIRNGHRIRTVQKDTDIVIEGSPRMANTFFVEAFDSIQNKELKISHHLHTPVQIIRGAQLKIPTVVLIRHPKDACISHSFLMDSTGEDPLERSLYWYVDFYSKITKLKKDYVVSKFEDSIKNPGKTIDAVNKKYGTNFVSYDDKVVFDEGKIKDILTEKSKKYTWKFYGSEGKINPLTYHLPHEEKKKRKEQRVKELESPKLKPLYEKALKLYLQIIE